MCGWLTSRWLVIVPTTSALHHYLPLCTPACITAAQPMPCALLNGSHTSARFHSSSALRTPKTPPQCNHSSSPLHTNASFTDRLLITASGKWPSTNVSCTSATPLNTPTPSPTPSTVRMCVPSTSFSSWLLSRALPLAKADTATTAHATAQFTTQTATQAATKAATKAAADTIGVRHFSTGATDVDTGSYLPRNQVTHTQQQPPAPPPLQQQQQQQQQQEQPVPPGVAKPPATFPEGKAFQAYSREGRPIPWSHITERLLECDIILLGEFHDDAVAHHLEMQVWKVAIEACGTGGGMTRRPVLSLEMFETDTQVVINEYLLGLVRDQDLGVDGRAWPNYKQDYHAMVQAAREHGAQVVCANAPRRLVSLVGRRGASVLNTLPSESQSLLPPLPITPASEQYRRKIDALMSMARTPPPPTQPQPTSQPTSQPQQPAQTATLPPVPPKPSPSSNPAPQQKQPQQQQQQERLPSQSASSPSSSTSSTSSTGEKPCPYIGLSMSSNFYDAQNLWDATMAYRLASVFNHHNHHNHHNHTGTPATTPDAAPALRPLVVHVCGKAHCEGGLGIVEHLGRYAPNVKVMVICFLPARTVRLSPAQYAHENLAAVADFVVLTDGTKSFSHTHPV